MKSITLMRLAAIAILVSTLMAVAVVPASIVEAQSGRQPPKKKVEKKTDEKPSDQKSKPAEEPGEPLPPIPRDQKDEPPIKISTQVVNVEISVIDK